MKRKVKSYLLIIIALVIINSTITNQKQVSAQTTVGVGISPLADYPDLPTVFEAINTGEITGEIELWIMSNLWQIVPAVINASGTGGANYSKIIIRPVYTGIHISGNVEGPIIDLNGADNVLIHGCIFDDCDDWWYDMTINNINTGIVNGTSVVRFRNSANDNAIRNCRILSSASGTDNTASIIFSTTVSGFDTGNSNNIIENCRFSNANNNRPTNIIISIGSKYRENTGNLIIKNLFYNHHRNDATSYGIKIGDYSENFEISNNGFFEEEGIVAEANLTIYPIYANIETGNGKIIIKNNYLGGSDYQCSGDAFDISDNGTGRRITYYGITLIGSATADKSELEGNRIQNIQINNTANKYVFTGISSNAKADIEMNWIGSTMNNDNIIINGNGNTNHISRGISIGIRGGSDGLFCSSNQIGGITLSTTNAERQQEFMAIEIITGSEDDLYNIFNNMIGSAAIANSIQTTNVNSSNEQRIHGINITAPANFTIGNNTIANLTNTAISNVENNNTSGIHVSGAGRFTIKGNNIFNLSSNSTSIASNENASVTGISFKAKGNAVAGYDMDIRRNKIYNLSNPTESTAHVKVFGIYYDGPEFVGSSNIHANFIHNLSVSPGNASTGIFITGLNIINSSVSGDETDVKRNIYNNVISLGKDVVNDCRLRGILESGNAERTNNIYFNTIYIEGETSGIRRSAAIETAGTGACIRDIRNNIFVNRRSRTTGIGSHYAAYYENTNGITTNYNNYYADGEGAILAFWGANRNSLTELQTAGGQDSDSYDLLPEFVYHDGSADSYYKMHNPIFGEAIADYNTDYESSPRQTPPCIGAFENLAFVSVFGAHERSNGSYLDLKKAFEAINSQYHSGKEIEVVIHRSIIEGPPAILDYRGWNHLYIYPEQSDIIVSNNSSNNNPLITLTDIRNITIDGRANRNGENQDLSLINNRFYSLAPNTNVIRILGIFENNTIKYCNLKGSSTHPESGIIKHYNIQKYIAMNNLIEYCNFTNANSNRPIQCIFLNNMRGNNQITYIIRNCNFYNHHRTYGESYAILVNSHSSGNLIIENNSFFETQEYTATNNSAIIPIRLRHNSSAESKYVINNNYFGGTGPECGTENEPCIFDANEYFWTYRAIDLTGYITSVPDNKFTNNKIKNISILNSTSNIPFIGANLIGDNRFDISNNIIGDSIGNQSIYISSNRSTNSYSYGIIYHTRSSSIEYSKISDNNIGSIRCENVNENGSHSFMAIQLQNNSAGDSVFVTNNIIGSNVTSNSIICENNSTNDAQQCIGIDIIGGPNISVYNNTISNLSNLALGNDEGTGNIITAGIRILNTANSKVENNIISNLSSNLKKSENYSSYGILSTSTNNVEILNNQIRDIVNNNLEGDAGVCGIFLGGTGSAITSQVYNNFINSLKINPDNNNDEIRICGIHLDNHDSGSTDNIRNIFNNVIALGNNVNNNCKITGIFETNVADKTNNIVFNTVYIAGETNGNTNTHALKISGDGNNIRNIRNNIFVNRRSNNGGTGSHYAAYYESTSGITANYNNYYTDGEGGILAYWGSNRNTLIELQTEGGLDNDSYEVLPDFVYLDGSVASYYKIINPIIGETLADYDKDYESSTRNTPPCIGAFEKQAFISVRGAADGSNGSFDNLEKAFDAIIGLTQTDKEIEVIIHKSHELNNSALLLNTDWDHLYIYPDREDISIKGNVHTIVFDGINNTTIDGRVNMTGENKDLTLINDWYNGNVIHITNDFYNNTIKYCVLNGGSNNTIISHVSPVEYLYQATNNVIEYCDFTNIHTDSRPAVCISLRNNRGNNDKSYIIKNCNFFNHLRNNATSYAIHLYHLKDTEVEIANNSFYESQDIDITVSSDMTLSYVYIVNQSEIQNKYIINNNYFGGKGPFCGTENEPLTINANNNRLRFMPMVILGNFGNSKMNQFKNNTIQNISINNTTDKMPFIGAGMVGIFDISNNIIGDTVGNESIYISSNRTQTSISRGIWFTSVIISPATSQIVGNTIGSIKCVNVNPTGSHSFNALGFTHITTADNLLVSGNLIGSNITPNSIVCKNISTNNTQECIGMHINGGPNILVKNNIISNMSNNATGDIEGTGSILTAGIRITGNTNCILENNTISHLNSNLKISDKYSSYGIFSESGRDVSIVNNRISNIINNNTEGNAGVCGIYLGGTGSAITSQVYNNFINSLKINPDNNNDEIRICGIHLDNHDSGSTDNIRNIFNNLIALGNNVNNNCKITGIFETNVADKTNNIVFNTVYIAGETNGNTNTHALKISGDGNNIRDIRNNNLTNSRYSNSGSAKHYAAYYGNTNGITADNNNYFASGNGAVTAFWEDTEYTYLQDFKTASSQDTYSISGNPGFINPDGSNPEDYKPDITNPNSWNINGMGVQISEYSEDFEGNPRSTSVSSGAPDIGAFEIHPVSTPISASHNGTIADGQTSEFFINGRKIAEINWHQNEGSLPNSVDIKQYSGENPGAPHNDGALHGNIWWDIVPDIQPTDGAYYDIELFYTPAQLYTIPSALETQLAHRPHSDTYWRVYGDSESNISPIYSVKQNGLNRFSEFSLSDKDNPLPVKLVDFYAFCQPNNEIIIAWISESEFNNDYYLLEKSSDMINFTEIARINGAGYSNSRIEYEYTDRSASSGDNYYRLTQVDFDGTSERFKTIHTNCANSDNQNTEIDVYPNPFVDIINISIHNEEDCIVMVKIYDESGRIVHMDEISHNSYKHTHTINLYRLPSSVYFIKVIGKSIVYNSKLIKTDKN